MTEEAQIRPAALKVVAIIFLLGGIWAVIEMLLQLSTGHLNINFGALGVFIGPGLLRGSRGWRTCGLVLLWLGMLLVLAVAFVFLQQDGPLDVSFLGRKVGKAPPMVGVAMAGAVFLFFFWMYWVLTRADVRAFFDLPPKDRLYVSPDP